jgi:Tfp pilus assembly protein PilF
MKKPVILSTIISSLLLLTGCASSGAGDGDAAQSADGLITAQSRAELQTGWELLVARDYVTARDHYEAMLVDYPRNPYAHLNLGVTYNELGETELARRHYEAAAVEGEDAEIAEVVEDGEIEQLATTVADVARANLEDLPN